MSGPTLYLGRNVTVNDSTFDFGDSSAITAQTPVANYDVSNKMYVDDSVRRESLRIDAIVSTLAIDLDRLKDLKDWLDSLDPAELTSVLTTLGTDIALLKTNLAKEISDRVNAINSVLAAVAGEYTERIVAEGLLGDRITGFQTLYDAYVASNNTRSNNIEASVALETAARIAGDSSISQNILSLDTRLSADILAAKTSVQNFAQNLIDNEALVRSNANIEINDKLITLNNDISTEKSLRETSDTNLETSINTEKSLRETAVIAVNGRIDNFVSELTLEATNRSEGITKLTGDLNTEITNRINSDNNIQSNIDAEATSRSNKDTQLEDEITALKGILNTLKTDTTTTLEMYARKINLLYLTFYHNTMENATGVDSDYQMMFQYGPGAI